MPTAAADFTASPAEHAAPFSERNVAAKLPQSSAAASAPQIMTAPSIIASASLLQAVAHQQTHSSLQGVQPVTLTYHVTFNPAEQGSDITAWIWDMCLPIAKPGQIKGFCVARLSGCHCLPLELPLCVGVRSFAELHADMQLCTPGGHKSMCSM